MNKRKVKNILILMIIIIADIYTFIFYFPINYHDL